MPQPFHLSQSNRGGRDGGGADASSREVGMTFREAMTRIENKVLYLAVVCHTVYCILAVLVGTAGLAQ